MMNNGHGRPALGRAAALTLAFVLAAGRLLLAAVGCDLNDPDRDVKRLFPDSTGYKTIYVSIAKRGGAELLRRIEDRLGDRFQGLFETADVPFTMYEIYRGDALVGYIHGVNQKGSFGGLQVFLALDLEGTIRSFYFQKLTAKDAKAFRDPAFGRQFEGLSLKDFYGYDVRTGPETAAGPAGRIRNPAPESEADFRAVLRAVKKNLILVDEFLLANRHLSHFNPGHQSPSRDSTDVNPWRNSEFPATGTGAPTSAEDRSRRRKSMELQGESR